MDAIAVLTDAEWKKLRTFDGKPAALGAKISIDRHPGKAVLNDPGALFLVMRRPNNQLWLVAMLFALERDGKAWAAHPNNTPVIDISSISDRLVPLELRPLTSAQRELLRHVASDSRATRPPFAPRVPKWLLEQLEAPEEAVPAALPLPKPKLPKKLALLAQLVAAQLDEVQDDLRASPKRFLARKNAFTRTVQSIFEGSGDEARLLRDELAPWKSAGDVDSAAKRAIEDLCRGIVALAQGRDREVPKACASYRALVDAYVPWMRALLA